MAENLNEFASKEWLKNQNKFDETYLTKYGNKDYVIEDDIVFKDQTTTPPSPTNEYWKNGKFIFRTSGEECITKLTGRDFKTSELESKIQSNVCQFDDIECKKDTTITAVIGFFNKHEGDLGHSVQLDNNLTYTTQSESSIYIGSQVLFDVLIIHITPNADNFVLQVNLYP